MNNIPTSAMRTIEPAYLGPVEPQPSAGAPSPVLFPGDRELLGKTALKRRADLWSRVSPHLDKLMAPDEHVMHVAAAVQRVSAFRAMAMGMMVYAYHQVALVVTDKRLIEVLLDTRGKGPESRIRSVPWRAVSEARVRFGQFRLKTCDGKKIAWSLRVRGDRKRISALIVRMNERNLIGGAASTEKLPVIHCPGCGGAFKQEPDRCEACGTIVRSKRLARGLSLAFPGAGLFYLGHPVLGTFDFLGEMMLLFIVGITAAAASDHAAIVRAAGMGLFLLVLTKFESLHVGEVLAERLRPEPEARRGRWKKFGMGGAFASVLALILVGSSAGSLAGKVDRDLDFSGAGPEWAFTREPAKSRLFSGNPAVRSEWTHADGRIVVVFAYPLSPMESFEDMQREILAQPRMEPHAALEKTGDLSPDLAGFSAVRIDGEDGIETPLAYVNYFVFDKEGKDLHQILEVVPQAQTEMADRTIHDLLRHASWVAPPRP